MNLRLRNFLKQGLSSLARLGSSKQLDVVEGLCDTPRLVRAMAAAMPAGAVLVLYGATDAIAAAAHAYAVPARSTPRPDLVVPLSPSATEALAKAAQPDYALATAFFVLAGAEESAPVLIENYDGADYVYLTPELAPEAVRRFVELSGGRLIRAHEQGTPG
jgi:hypothetical protein